MVKKMQLEHEIISLRARLEEAEGTLRAIHSGGVDALVISTEQGEQIFTLKGADQPFRLLIENMSEGALTMTRESIILYANRRFAQMLQKPLEKVLGSSLLDWISPADREKLQTLLDKEHGRRRLAGLNLIDGDGGLVPAQLSLINLQLDGVPENICVVVTDLTEHKCMEEIVHAERIARAKMEASERSRRTLLRLIEEQKRIEEALRKSEQQLARELETAELLQELSTQLIRADNVEALYDQLLATMLKIMRSDFATIQRFHPERGTEGELYLLRDYGFGEFDTGCWEWITPHSRSSCGLALKTRRRVVYADVLQCDYIAGSDVLEQYRQAGIRAVQTTPLLSRSGAVLGMISTHWREPHELTEGEIRSLDVLARQAADLIERNFAEEALQKAHDQLEHKVTERTAQLTRTNEILQQEIKERKQAERALQESEELYRSLVENANESIIVIKDGIIKFANPMAEQVFSCSADRITSLPFLEFIHPDDRYLILERPKKRLIKGKPENPFIYRLIACDGNTRHIQENSAKIEWGGSSAILALLTDITEFKKMEEEMLKADKLEAIGLLAGGIAHDFNNYLATFLANISLAKLFKDDKAKIEEKLANMEKATLRAKDLSNQLFTFARGGAPFKEKISIKQLIMDDIKFALSGSQVHPDIIIDAGLHMVYADAGQLSQVLNNIAINAVQAMPEGGALQVRAENTSPADSSLPLPQGPYVKITIRDGGTGIPAKYLPKIFDPFFTTKDKGRGLGLATSYSIIKKHDGHLKVESEMGVGTSFYIFLPAISPAATNSSVKDTVFQGKGKILIMDDEEDLLTATGETLTTLGYDVTLSRNGGQAVELFTRALEQNQPFNLVILDLTIPGGMGGKQTIKEMLKLDPGVKAIVASGYSNDPILVSFGDYGFKAAVKKPFTLEKLSETIKNILF